MSVLFILRDVVVEVFVEFVSVTKFVDVKSLFFYLVLIIDFVFWVMSFGISEKLFEFFVELSFWIVSTLSFGWRMFFVLVNMNVFGGFGLLFFFEVLWLMLFFSLRLNGMGFFGFLIFVSLLFFVILILFR